MINILIADDHPIVRRGLVEILAESRDVFNIDEACNGQEVLTKVEGKNYDVVLLDISMPGISGMDVLKQLKSQKGPIRVLMLSRYQEDQYALRVIKAGADGFLTKESAPEELIRAIKKVAQGGKYVSPSLAEKMAVYLGVESDKKAHETLSDREFQVMLKIAAGKTASEIADEMSLSVNTVSTYRRRVLNKMNIKNNAQIMHYALNEGLIE